MQLCQNCKYFFINWKEPDVYRYGCRAFSIKSNLLPCYYVFQQSRIQCLYFEKKLNKLNKTSPKNKTFKQDNSLDVQV